MNVLSLFTGVGGLDLGLERAGHEIVGQCEFDAAARRVLRRHWPNVPISENVETLDADWLRDNGFRLGGRSAERGDRPDDNDQFSGDQGLQRRGRDGNGGRERELESGDAVLSGLRRGSEDSRRRIEHASGENGRLATPDISIDLVCGGFPCQDLSLAGRRKGLDGDRSGLFYDAARIADLVLGDGGWILVENVPGLLSSNGGRDLGLVLQTLAKLGFHDLAYRVLDSRYFGVPQRRRRVFILARRARGDRARTVLLESERGGGNFAPRSRSRSSAPAETDRSAEESGGPVRAAGAEVEVETREAATTLTSGSTAPGVSTPGRRQEDDFNLVTTTALTSSLGGADDNDAQGNQLVVDENLRSPERTEVEPIPEHEASSEWPKPNAPTLDTFLGHGQLENQHVMAGCGLFVPDPLVRRLTPTECERLQGFPDRWTIVDENPEDVNNPKPDGARYKQMGNAVTVNVAEWIAHRLNEHGGVE